MNDSLFTEGITHFMLIDQQGNALSERLVFVPDRKTPQWQITPDRPTYEKREKVSLNISIKDDKGNPVTVVSPSALPTGKVSNRILYADNIVSNLLLTSDLKGYVEDPGFYFLRQDARTLRSLDFLMMTHGWRRYKFDNVLRAPSLNFTNYIEKGQTISGRIKGFFGGNVKKGSIVLLAPKQNIIATTTTDEKENYSQYLIQRQYHFPHTSTYKERFCRS